MTASYDFVQLDVFTRTPLAGNPLAVFTDARGLTDKQMQALAREMNLSETTFILPREPEPEATNGKRVRIFTTREELPFAGHPTLGTALYLYSITDTAPDEIVLDLERGEVANHDFRHASHLHVAWVYLTESSSTNEAAAKMRSTLRRFASSLGNLEKYHETVTLFWVHFLARESWVEPDLKSFSQAVDTDQLSGSASEKEL
jgi:PhzF family phenazine biosynthesis protein